MAMPRKVNCRSCGGHVSVVGDLSARKRCLACGEAAVIDAITQMREKRGEVFDRWRANLVLAVLNLDGGHGPSDQVIADALLREALRSPQADALT